MRVFHCIFILSICFAGLAGEELRNLSSQDAVELALEENPVLPAGRARVQAAEGMRAQATLRPNPRLYLQSENTRFASTDTPFRFSRETDNFAYASQVLEAPGKRQGRINFNGEVIRSREAEVELLRARIGQSVAAAYWAAVGAERTLDILRQTLKNFDETVQYHRDRVREGALAEVDLIRIEVERQQVSVQLQNAQQDVRRLRLDLFRQMGRPTDDTGVVLTGQLGDVRPFVAVTPEEALAQRRDLLLDRQLVQQAKAATRMEQLNARPDPEVLFGYKRTAGYDTMIAGFQLPLPFLNKNQGAIVASAAEAKAAEHDLRSTEIAARSQIAMALSEYEQKYRLVTETLPRMRAQAEDTVRIARAVYREGASDLLRLLDAERVELQAHLLFVRTLADYQLALVNLRAATGVTP